MYKVLIVDDEPIVSVTIKSLVKWNEHNIDMAYEAHNGKQALNLLTENTDIDIVMTDINMPVMDGLKLIEEMKERRLSQAIIVLSAYEDYKLVRSAFKYGVRDYILKTEIDANKLLDVLKNVTDKLETEELKAVKAVNRTDTDYLLSKEMLLKEMLHAKRTDFSEHNLQHLRISSSNMIVCFLWIDDFYDIEERYANSTLTPFIDSTVNTIKQSLDKLDYGEAISISPDEYVIVLSFPKVSAGEIKLKLDTLLHEIKNNLSYFLNMHVTIGVSDVDSGFEKAHELFMQAEKNARFRFIFGKQKIIYPQDVVLIDVKDNLSIIPKTDEFVEALKGAEEENVMIELENLLELIASQRAAIDKILMYYTEIIFVLIKCINDMGEDVTTVFGKDVNFYQQITKFETGQEINIWIRNLVGWVVGFIKDKKESKMSFAMTKAISFIKENFKDENISVWMVSNYMGLNIINSVESISNKSTDKYYVSAAVNPQSDNEAGDVELIYISTITNALDVFETSANEYRVSDILILDNNEEIIFSQKKSAIGNSYYEISNLMEKIDKKERTILEVIDNEQYMITSSDINKTGWTIFYLTKISDAIAELNVISRGAVIFLIVMLCLFAGFSVYFLQSIVIPIKNLILTMKIVENGNFDTAIEVKSSDELYQLGNAFNRMVKKVQNLIVEKNLKEKEKNEAEMEALQAQINPHFISNTLSTIRFMAMIAKVDNIKEMTEAFINIVTSSFNRNSRFHTIETEIHVLESYIHIMQVRYGNKFAVSIKASDEVKSFYILKMLIQPIVENAIVHGLSDSEGDGEIAVRFKKENDTLLVEVEDNGVGIDEEKITKVLTEDHRSKKGFTGLGINNVDQRIKLNHGNDFGLSIESELDCYTLFKITLPLIKHIDKNEK